MKAIIISSEIKNLIIKYINRLIILKRRKKSLLIIRFKRLIIIEI